VKTTIFMTMMLTAAGLAGAGYGGTTTQTAEQKGPLPVTVSTNPLIAPFETPFGVPPFSQIKDDHYIPAFERGMEEQRAEVQAIISNPQEATFENSVAALDYSGSLLSRVSNVFLPMHSAESNDRIQEIAKEIAPKLSAHRDQIVMEPRLFERIKDVHDRRDGISLAREQRRLLEEMYKKFVRGGAQLEPAQKARLAGINQRISVLEVQFGDDLLAENNEFKLIIEKSEDLSGLPANAVTAAAEAANRVGFAGKWMFTLHKPSWIPFLQFSDRRDLRREMFEGYIERGNHDDKNDNKAILAELAKLRIEAANLLGYPSHAHYVLSNNMAGTPDKVYELLNQLWEAALPVTRAEAAALQEMIDQEGGSFELAPWDWWYYTEKIRKQKYQISDEELRPYFELANVQQGAFDIAARLYNLRFVPRDDLPVYQKDVKAVEVLEKEGNHIGVLYLDYFPRPGKRQGAWMTAYRNQEVRMGQFVTPVVANVFNFSEPTADAPALLSLEEVETLFHEFGHALHGLLSQVTFPSLAGTNVVRDFVELPSQFMENWAVEPTTLKHYALHYESGVPIPDALIEKIREARHFNQGFETTEYLAASFLDLDWHTLTQDPGPVDVNRFEQEGLDRIGLIPQIVSRYRSPYFAHIFSGGYSSGYYSYIWSAVLESDAYTAFQEKENLFDAATAAAFREFILSAGNTADPMELYVQFRGRTPEIEPLLEKRGLK
jgi:peptidyl-dipeptidase Dcp